MSEPVWELAGRVVLVTGGAGGIGLALGRALLNEGAIVVLLDLNPRPEALAGAHTLGCDVTHPSAVDDAIEAIVEQHGRLDVLINNAGISHRSDFVDTDARVLRQVMEVNFFGSVNCTRAALPHLLRSGGQVVVVSSVAGFAPLVGRTGYAASKHALHGFFDSLRAELADTSVSVLMVCPYFTDTPLRERALDGTGQPLGHGPRSLQTPLRPEDVARAVLESMKRGDRMRVLGAVGRLSWWVSRFAPATYERLMRRSQA